MNKIIAPLVSLSVVSILLTSLACERVRAPIQARADPFQASQVMLTDNDLRKETAVGQPTATRDDAGNLLLVQVPIRSAVNRRLYIQYTVKFFDRSGREISSSGPFTKTLDPNVPEYLQANSMSQAATDFQFNIRYAR